MKCISCDAQGNQAGHYFPTTYSALRFNEYNVNLQCTKCNCYEHGAAYKYRIGLVQRYGEDAVKQLEHIAIHNRIKKWSREELDAIQRKYKDADN